MALKLVTVDFMYFFETRTGTEHASTPNAKGQKYQIAID